MIGPAPAGGGEHVEVAVRFAAAGGRVDARVETRAGDAEWQPVELPLPAGQAEELARRALLDAGVPGRCDEPTRRLGEALFRGLFHGSALERYRAAQGPVSRAAPVRLRFHLGAGSAAERALHRLPWELLCEPGPGGGRLLALDRRLSVVRHLTIGDGVAPMARPPRLRVLVAAAEGRAPGVPELDLRGEIAGIRAGCPRGGAVEVEVLRPATLDDLVERLRAGDFHVLHLSGHGDRGGDDGVVLIPEADGRLVPRRGEQLAPLLGGLSPLRLVVLNACRTAETVAHRPFAGVAAAFLAHGLPAAVAMQAPIRDDAAARFAAALYARLAAGAGLDAAVAEGRLAISRHRPRTFEWAVPVLFSRLPGGELFAAPAAGAAPADGGVATVAHGGAPADRRTGGRRRWLPRAAAAAIAALALATVALVLVERGRDDRGEERRASGLLDATHAPVVGEAPRQGPAGGGAEVGDPPPELMAGSSVPLGHGRAGDAGAAEGTPDLPGSAAEGPGDAGAEDGASQGSRAAEAAKGDAGAGGSDAAPPSPSPFPPPRCGSSVVVPSGETLSVPELGATLVPQIGERAVLGTYVTVYLVGPGVDTHQSANRAGNLDFRPDAPLEVDLLGFDPVAGTVRLTCRVDSQPP